MNQFDYHFQVYNRQPKIFDLFVIRTILENIQTIYMSIGSINENNRKMERAWSQFPGLCCLKKNLPNMNAFRAIAVNL